MSRLWDRSCAAGSLSLALLLPGCMLFGGQTGECDAAPHGPPPPPCVAQPLAFEQPSSAGYSAAELVEAWGGGYLGAAPLPEPIGGADRLTTVAFTVSYDGGEVTADSCTGRLTVAVLVTLELDDGRWVRTTTGSLVGSLTRATLDAEFLPAADDLDATLSLGVSFAATETVSAALLVGAEPAVPFTALREP